MIQGHSLVAHVGIVLAPAHWLAGQIGLPDHLPAVELAVGLVFLASCFGLALHGLYAWARSKKFLPLIAAIVAIVAGVIMLLATVTFRHLWLYTLILDVVAADMYWRILNRNDLPKPIRRAGTLWAAASLLLCAGTPGLFIVHTWFTERSINHSLQTRLEGEQKNLTSDEQTRTTNAVAALAKSPELLNNTFVSGDPLLLATVQRLGVEQGLPYLVVVDGSGIVLARSQPVAAFGDAWPVTLDLHTQLASGLTQSERGSPLLVSSHPLSVAGGKAVTLIGGVLIDQSFLSTRSNAIHATLFLTSDQGVTALAAPEGNAVNALSSTSVDTFLAARTGKSGTFSLASDGKRYLVDTQPLIGVGGQVIGTLGTADVDGSTDFRLRLDLVIMIALAIFVLALPALVWRKKKEIL